MDGLPRLLKFRSGHHAPPTQIRHYGESGYALLSIGQDQSLRQFSVIRDAQNVEFSQGSLLKKAKKLNTQIDLLKFPQPLQFSACKLIFVVVIWFNSYILQLLRKKDTGIMLLRVMPTILKLELGLIPEKLSENIF